LKFKAKKKAEKESSGAEYEEEKEELDVEDEKVKEVLEPSFLTSVMEKTDDIHVGDYTLKAMSVLSGLSRSLTGMTLNLWSVGSSGAGKTHCFQTIFKTIPNEYKIKFNSCSPKALYYFTKKYKPGVLDGKVVLFNEAEASEEAKEVLRSITDPNEEDANLLTVIDQQSVEISIKGSPVTWFTSVDPIEDEQLKNRFMFSNPEEGSDHKDKIADHQKEKIKEGVLRPIIKKDYPDLKAGFRKIIEETKDLKVLVPYDWEWQRKENPRLQPWFGSLIHLIAKVHHHDRPIIDNHIIATADDFYIAKFLWDRVEKITLQQLKEKDFEVLQEIPDTKDDAVN